jgi:hypothetical protein
MSGPFKMKGFPLIEGTSPAKDSVLSSAWQGVKKAWKSSAHDTAIDSTKAGIEEYKKARKRKKKSAVPMKDSPAKCPLIAAVAPALIGAMAKKKKE